MKTLKKYYLYLSILILIIVFGLYLFNHPLFRPILSYTQLQTLADFTLLIELDSKNDAQALWNFREFYSRGTIQLEKFEKLNIPKEITEFYPISSSFIPHTLFVSNKIKSVEGFVSDNELVFLTKDQIKKTNWEIYLQTEYIQVLKHNILPYSFVIAVFDIDTASQANGYLYLDLNDKNFSSQVKSKKWFVISHIKQ